MNYLDVERILKDGSVPVVDGFKFNYELYLQVVNDKKVHVSTSKVVKCLVDRLRDNKDMNGLEFTHSVSLITHMLFSNLERDLPIIEKEFYPPSGEYLGTAMNHDKIAIFPILRAGSTMEYGLREILPGSRVYPLGMMRNEETFRPVLSYNKLPKSLSGITAIVTDTMLATGGSLCYALSEISKLSPENMIVMSVISAPEGVNKIRVAFSDVSVYVASLDLGLDGKKYIVPGIGDAGDIAYNTRNGKG